MESQTTDKLTSSKPMQHLLKESVQGKLAHVAFACESPFRLLPNISTPPSRFGKIKNPFDTHLLDRLNHPVLSPSVFSKTPKPEEKFKWTIEDISCLKPAEIDEKTIELVESPYHDHEEEQTVQAKIDKFFRATHIVPSPLNTATNSVPLISDCISSPERNTLSDGVTQTVLSLPAKLPETLEAMLKPYFSYTLDQQQSKTGNDMSLYRQLFEPEEQPSPQSVNTSPALSCDLSPVQFSPYDCKRIGSHRNSGSPHDAQALSDCNLSPIGGAFSSCNILRAVSATRLNFSEDRMSVDNSLNLVPDYEQMLPRENDVFENGFSPVCEVLNDSTVYWDMEYKKIALTPPKLGNVCNNMDVSNSNTPRYKILYSQRKKLSDSFEENEVYTTNQCDRQNTVNAKSPVHTNEDTLDAGYLTGGAYMSEGPSWSSSPLSASTPTKKASFR